MWSSRLTSLLFLLLLAFGGRALVHSWTSSSLQFRASSCLFRAKGRRSHFSSLRLFFRSKESSRKLPPSIFQELSTANVTLPYSVQLGSQKTGGSSGVTSETLDDCELILRSLQWKDVKAVTDLCVNEYGDDPYTISSSAFSPSFWTGWSEYLSLRLLVDVTMRLKVPMPPWSRQQHVPSDHAVVLLCNTRANKKDRNDADASGVIGMIEISRQPPLPHRNPPPVPIPTFVKHLLFPGNEFQGWITNLLIAPEYRGKGYAKLLLAACEGIAKSWSCQSISLHCDANVATGNVAQQLYERAGYLPLMDLEDDDSSNPMLPEFSWITQEGPSATLRSSVVVIEGVPLLYLRKKLD